MDYGYQSKNTLQIVCYRSWLEGARYLCSSDAKTKRYLQCDILLGIRGSSLYMFVPIRDINSLCKDKDLSK